ncbi:endoplasmic reticulum resident protein 44 [Rhopalosiphum maidis]|uniref:endoplasmic reticulum resident protein 44 n=1 Tax=Rhopalosiphum maidis TaxID=43146 RepID=UPI000EFE88D8|nr:endoplasmic reticulum resident protein 44 [Rhopalosiphum maidis]
MNQNYWKIFANKLFLLFFSSTYLFYNPVTSNAVKLHSQNVDMTLASNELVIINFYADWCRFSGILTPIFDEAAAKVSELYPESGKVVLGKVDCDSETSIASRFQITKYPTIKVLINGQPAKREYRGKRSVEAFVSFVQKQLEDPIQEVSSLFAASDVKSRVVIGYFENKDSQEYQIFRKVATNLKDDCLFYAGVGEAFRAMHPPNETIIEFRPDRASPKSEHHTFTGNSADYDSLNIWATDNCLPLVREITFENAEEITEEGLPFLLFFYHPNDLDSIKLFKEIVGTHLVQEKQRVNFLTADGIKFAHPLQHLGKQHTDLPVVVIDSFKHMYQFPSKSDYKNHEHLKTFIDDLYSGKLHREYHLGPQEISAIEIVHGDNQPAEQTMPPESTFKKLAPSKNRYTLLKEEL